jgi:predicted ribosome quality control (RQC) complex YloA/Tae2 family protein
LGDDRAVVVEAVARNKLMQRSTVRLIAELKGVGSNIILCDETGMILGSLRREESEARRIVPGEQYTPMPQRGPVPAKAQRNRFADVEREDPLALSRAVQAHYASAEAEAARQQQAADVAGRLHKALAGAQRRLRHAEEAVERADNADTVRRLAELLQIHAHEIGRGATEVTVPDVFVPEQPDVTIPLDPVLTAQENAQRYFRRYRKARDAGESAAGRLDETRRELAGLLEIKTRLHAAEGESDLAEVSRALDELGVPGSGEGGEPRTAAGEPAGPRRFVSADGLEILVSRNRKQNDRLTFSTARGNDWWVHLVAWPGPHVVVRQRGGGAMPQESLLDAAHLAVHFSKIRGAESAEVVYTQCKNVRRARGGGPGRVNYAQARNLRVRMEDERLRRLLRSH